MVPRQQSMAGTVGASKSVKQKIRADMYMTEIVVACKEAHERKQTNMYGPSVAPEPGKGGGVVALSRIHLGEHCTYKPCPMESELATSKEQPQNCIKEARWVEGSGMGASTAHGVALSACWKPFA